MELNLVKDIKRLGLEKVCEIYDLSAKDYGHKVLIKYDQISSPMNEESVKDARGIILEKNTWKVMSLAFRKFFNSSETNADKIDWGNALILEKLDGTLIQLYWDWVINQWCVGTTGTADGSGEVNNKMGTSFADLFWSTLGKVCTKFEGIDKMDISDRDNSLSSVLNKEFIWVFELTTPYNIVVKPHSTSTATLLTIRNVNTLEEFAYDSVSEIGDGIGLPVVKVFDINASNAGHVISTLENMPYTEEGYVVVDANFNRIKIKNPSYVSVHHLKSRTSEHAIMEIVKTNEVEEFASTFPERRDEIFVLKNNYDNLHKKLHDVWVDLKGHLPRNITKEEQKRYATSVFTICDDHMVKMHTGLFFGLKDGKVKSIDRYLIDMDNKRLYEILT